MRLYYEPCGLEISIPEGRMSGICLENPMTMQKFVSSLWRQSNGAVEDIFITDGDKSISLNKDVNMVFNPFSLDVNEKKILTKVMSEMQVIGETELYLEMTELNAAIVTFLDKLNQRMPYPLTYSLDLDVQQLLKSYAVKIDMQSESLSGRIVNYMKLGHQVLGVRLFVFLHLRDYLSMDDFEKIYEMVAYEQISVLLLESRMTDKLPQERWWIIDADNCIIEI